MTCAICKWWKPIFTGDDRIEAAKMAARDREMSKDPKEKDWTQEVCAKWAYDMEVDLESGMCNRMPQEVKTLRDYNCGEFSAFELYPPSSEQ